jgi:hypothetical protein
MKFTTVATDAFQKFQLNAGVVLTEFDPASPTLDRSKIFLATSGGSEFTAEPEFEDFGEDVDNVPANTKELKVLTSVNVTLSGTGKTVDGPVLKALMAAADITTASGVTKITPRADLLQADFIDNLWWVGDYSDHNGNTNGGFVAIELLNALSTGGFSLQSNDKGKADVEYEFTGHYSISDMTLVPYNVYLKAGTAEPTS